MICDAWLTMHGFRCMAFGVWLTMHGLTMYGLTMYQAQQANGQRESAAEWSEAKTRKRLLQITASFRNDRRLFEAAALRTHASAQATMKTRRNAPV